MNELWSELYSISGWNTDEVKEMAPLYTESLNPSISEMISTSVDTQLPIVIPRLDENRQFRFYLIAKDDQQSEDIFLTVKAYLGGSYTTCYPMTFKSSEDSFEKSVLSMFPQGFKQINIHKECSANDKEATYWVIDSLNRAIGQFHHRPISISSVKRPVGVILRHFFIAVQKGKGVESLCLLDELRNHQRLSPRNLLSLEIQALAAGGQWQQLLGHPKLDDLTRGTIPRRLQNVLLASVGYECNNSTVPDDYDSERLSQRLQNLYPLFSTPPDLELDEPSADRWKLWCIGAVSLGRTTAIDQLPDTIESEWISDLRRWAGILPHDSVSIDTEVESLTECLTGEMTTDKAINLLAKSVQSNYSENQLIYRKLSEYPKDILANLSSINFMLPKLWKNLEEEYGDQLQIDNWLQLFQSFSGDCTAQGMGSALTLAFDRSEYWTADSWNELEVSSVIMSISDEVVLSTVRGVLPILICWLEEREQKLPSEVVEHLMMLLVSDEQIAAEDIILSTDLLLMLLDQPHTRKQYASAIDCIDMCWDVLKSPRAIDSILDVYETLADYSCADESKRLQSWLATQGSLVTLWPRLDNQQQRISRELANYFIDDLGAFPEVITQLERTESSVLPDISGKILAIYTLTEGAGLRAKKIIMNYFPDLDVQVNHDKKATDALLNLAKTADYFIFSSRSAAHQAFYPVSKQRKDLIYPQGKGASSIVREFMAYIS